MDFAVLGDDPACLPLVRAIEASQRHRVTAMADCARIAADLAATAPGARLCPDWQELLVVPQLDAVVVSGHRQSVLEGARQLAGAGKHLLLFPDSRQGAAFAYDLLPIHDERQVRLTPVFAHRLALPWRELQARIRSGDLAGLRYLQLEESHPADATGGLLSLTGIDNALLHDSDLLRWLAGDYLQVTCLQTGATADGAALVTVTLAGSGVPEATWTMRAAHAPARRQLTAALQGAAAKTVSDQPDAEPPLDVCAAVLQQFKQQVAGQSTGADWSDLVRAFDIVDGARRSVRRRRTVELSREEISERSQFKTHMTALGCGLLGYTLVGVVAALLVGKLCDPRDAAQLRSEAAGFVILRDEFAVGSPMLTKAGETHLDDLAAALRRTPAEIMVEAEGGDPAAVLNVARRAAVVDWLKSQKQVDVDNRTVVRALAGQVFRRLMVGVWLVVFLPLGLFLALQGLIVIARPAAGTDATGP
jgi:predicted dehydrogenase